MRPPLVLLATAAAMIGTAAGAFVVRPLAARSSRATTPAAATRNNGAARVRMLMDGTSSRRGLLEGAGKVGLLTLGLVGGAR